MSMAGLDGVVKMVEEWQPEALATELSYRDSLAALLRQRLKDAKIETEYRHHGTTTDVYVKKSGLFGDTQVGLFGATEVFIELKRNLQHKAQLDRLVGQIQDLQPKENKIIVLLCGETNPALVTRFQELFRDYLASPIGYPRPMRLIVKEPAKRAKAGKP